MGKWTIILVSMLLVSSLTACQNQKVEETSAQMVEQLEENQVVAGEKPDHITLEVDANFMKGEERGTK